MHAAIIHQGTEALAAAAAALAEPLTEEEALRRQVRSLRVALWQLIARCDPYAKAGVAAPANSPWTVAREVMAAIPGMHTIEGLRFEIEAYRTAMRMLIAVELPTGAAQ